MFTRRAFVKASIGALGLSRAQSAERSVTLTLHFCGGSAFRRSERALIAVQLSGKGEDGEYYKHPSFPHAMPHRSFIVLPKNTVANVEPFPSTYETTRLNARITPAEDWQPVCLEGKDVVISAEGAQPFRYQCKKVAHYGDFSSASWRPRGSWSDPSGELGHPVNSRFRIAHGVLKDGPPHDQHAKGRYWKIAKASWKTLSDVSTLTISGTTVSIEGLARQPIVVGTSLEAFVFAGPVTGHGDATEYYWLNHSLLLHTIFEIPPGDVRPHTDLSVKYPEAGQGAVSHPCDLHRLTPEQRGGKRVPPDSEYCPNYDEFP